MLQRVTIAAAEAHQPALTVADEPTSALDTELADKILSTLRARSRGLLLISHDLELAGRHADRIAVCHQGRIVEIGAAHATLTAPRHPYTAALLTALPVAVAPCRRISTTVPVVDARGLVRRYGQVTAVDGVDLTVEAAEIVGIMGASGSGKSTLLRLLGAIERPTSGEIWLGNQPAWSAHRANLPRPGYVMPIFQDPIASLQQRWPLWRIITEPLCAPHRGRRPSAQQRRALAIDGLARVGLSSLAPDTRPAELSVGQCQRISILRALIADPALLIADEPTSALDLRTTADILSLVRELAQTGTAIIVASHDGRMLVVFDAIVMPMAVLPINWLRASTLAVRLWACRMHQVRLRLRSCPPRLTDE